MDARHHIDDTSAIFSPGLIFFKELIHHNLQEAIRIAKGPERLRPHVKTHKTREIVRMELDAGVTKHKCATLAEAEMLAQCGVPDVFLSYNLVGPNCQRLGRLAKAFPETRFLAQVDNPKSAQELSAAMQQFGQTIDVLIDLDVGQHRTGIPPGDDAVELCLLLDRLIGVRPGGLHVYDGHNHQTELQDRELSVKTLIKSVLALREKLESKGCYVPRVICGGTPTFPIYAKMEFPGLELSPGTCFLHDNGYGTRFPDMTGFVPAALLLTRVISKVSDSRMTLDLGTKSVASDPPAGKRCIFPDLTEYEAVIHNEEHLVLETPDAMHYSVGDELLAIPTHVCPTCALHRSVYVVEEGRVIGQWDVVARDRTLTV